MSSRFESLNDTQCHEISYKPYCGTAHTNGWCQWSHSLGTCLPNFGSSAIFVEPFDPVIAKSVVISLYFVALYLVYKGSEWVVNRSKCFNKLSIGDKRKCILYIFELSVITFCFICAGYSGLLMFAFAPNSVYSSPESISRLTRGASTTHIITICYLMEFIFHPQMRYTIKIHHVASIVVILLFWIAMTDVIDLLLARVATVIMLFCITEQHVFIQLLSHNIYKPHNVVQIRYSFGWILHFVSALLYIVTRTTITVLHRVVSPYQFERPQSSCTTYNGIRIIPYVQNSRTFKRNHTKCSRIYKSILYHFHDGFRHSILLIFHAFDPNQYRFMRQHRFLCEYHICY
eukprot:843236_1